MGNALGFNSITLSRLGLSGAGEGLGMHWDSIKWPWLGLSGVGEGLGMQSCRGVGHALGFTLAEEGEAKWGVGPVRGVGPAGAGWRGYEDRPSGAA